MIREGFSLSSALGDEVQLLGFINAVLGKTGDDKFISIEILENKSFMAEIMGNKSCVLDVRAEMQNGTMVNIEVQLRDQKNIVICHAQRAFYAYKLILKTIESKHLSLYRKQLHFCHIYMSTFVQSSLNITN